MLHTRVYNLDPFSLAVTLETSKAAIARARSLLEETSGALAQSSRWNPQLRDTSRSDSALTMR
jgi:hypothetical protein